MMIRTILLILILMLGATNGQAETDKTVFRSNASETHTQRPFRVESTQTDPFTATAFITYRIHADHFITLQIIDNQGKVINTLFEGIQRAGSYSIETRVDIPESGVYYWSLQSGSATQRFAIALLR